MEEAAAKLAAVEEEEADDAARIGMLQAKVAALEEKCRHDVEVAVAKKHESMMQQRRTLLDEKDAAYESDVAALKSATSQLALAEEQELQAHFAQRNTRHMLSLQLGVSLPVLYHI